MFYICINCLFNSYFVRVAFHNFLLSEYTMTMMMMMMMTMLWTWRRLETVGRSGGTFPLQLGGVLTVPVDAVTRRTTITCTRLPAHLRYRHEPTLRYDHPA